MRLGNKVAVFILVFAFAASWVAAEPRLVDRVTVKRSTLSASVMLSHISGLLTSLWEAAGWSADPLGLSAPTTDEGWSADPLGSPTTDEGWSADPLG
jgi:hypothetical protein